MNQLSETAKRLLLDIKNSQNPTNYLYDLYNTCSLEEKEELMMAINELVDAGYLHVLWADNSPWYTTVRRLSNSITNNANWEFSMNNTVTVGNKNSLSNSFIASNSTIIMDQSSKKSFYERHPVVVGLLITLGGGLIMMFSFWGAIVDAVESLF